jgi:hypothetical protein
VFGVPGYDVQAVASRRSNETVACGNDLTRSLRAVCEFSPGVAGFEIDGKDSVGVIAFEGLQPCLEFTLILPAYPDYWRYREWKREFDKFAAANSAPNLMVMWLANDHFGEYARTIDGVNTPETQMADNDYAFGLIVDAVAKSPFAKDTLIMSIEDDAWDGADHVEAHRTVALIAGAYVRQHAVVSTRYTKVSLVKTIEEILGIGPIGLNDALAAPMSDVFDPNATNWMYKAIVPDILRSTRLPLSPAEHAANAVPRHSAAYWTKAMAGQDFSGPDCIDPVSFNRAPWHGRKGDEPYPAAPTGANPRANRKQLPAGRKSTRETSQVDSSQLQKSRKHVK